jgi:hypothetical protein
MKGRGLNPDDLELFAKIRTRVGACLWKLEQNGLARRFRWSGI